MGKRDTAVEDPGAELLELRRLLLGDGVKRLEHLEERLDNPAIRAKETASVLPDAIEVRGGRDRRLWEALGPLFEDSFRTAVRRNPQVIVEVLFPIILPAIRRSVAEALRGMVESLNRILDDSLSWRGLTWRLEAIRTGRSFAEVALSKSLLYRVDEVFLIHRDSGLVLASVRRDGAEGDPVVVSGMLTALQDFVRDSFQVSAAENLEDLKVGDTSVWVEQGPQAVIAAVIRGTPPQQYRDLLQDTLAQVHRDHGADWAQFKGDADPFAKSIPLLENCLQAQYERPSKGGYGKLLLATAVALAVLGLLLAPLAVHQWRWGRYLGLLRSEPGIVLTDETSGWTSGYVAGLRDPLSADPALLAGQAGLERAAVTADWEPYVSFHPAFVARRSQRETDRALAALRGLQVPFPLGSSELSPEAYQVMGRMGNLLAGIVGQADSLGSLLTVRVIGHSDESGTSEINSRLSQERAAAVASFLAQAYEIPIAEANGVGSEPPPGSVGGGASRSVRLEVQIGETNSPPLPSPEDR